MKVLFVSHVANFQKFNKPFIKWFKDNNCIVHYASYDDEPIECADRFFKIDFRRDPLDPHNIIALFQLIKLFSREKYDIIHCHTPVGAMLTRIAAVFSHKSKVIYTAHGFHFYKGAPLKNILVYKTAERILAHNTDALVTINTEDYNAAKKFKLRKNGRVYYINGVGTDVEKIRRACSTDNDYRKEIDVSDNSFVIVTVAELIKRKNLETAIKAFAQADIPGSVYLICGKGTEQDALKKLCEELGVTDRVRFLGYRTDIYNILGVSDLFLFTSHQEGLPIAVIEAMAAGLPCVVSDIRGNNELIGSENGILCSDNDVTAFAGGIKKLYENSDLRFEMGNRSREISEKYDVSIAVKNMAEIYKSFIK